MTVLRQTAIMELEKIPENNYGKGRNEKENLTGSAHGYSLRSFQWIRYSHGLPSISGCL